MKAPIRNTLKIGASLLILLLMAACASSKSKPDGAQSARNKLSELQANRDLAPLAPLAINDAEIAVRAAEVPTRDVDLGRHLVLIADRKVDIAWAQAQGRWSEDQREEMKDERDAARLDARTREADNAHREANLARTDAADARNETTRALEATEVARTETEFARIDADIARNETNVAITDTAAAKSQAVSARKETASERQRADDLQRQVSELNALETDRGLVITLGDVMFATGRAELNGGVPSNLGKLAMFLDRYPDRTVLIEGHTDNVGDVDVNQNLSLRRANSVQAFLVEHGVLASRLIATGKGETDPIASNDSDTGRQQNRRVEVIISNPALAAN